MAYQPGDESNAPSNSLSLSSRLSKFMNSMRGNPKRQSNPVGWPHSSKEEVNERPSRIIKIGQPQEFSFKSNFVKTSKYELWDFLGKFLLEEFNPYTKVANCYFLMISAMQCIPQISNTGGYPTTLIPLLFIIFVDAVFQLLEDASRHRADNIANSSKTFKYDKASNSFIDIKWYELQVGDFVRIDSRSLLPADIVILFVSEKTDPPAGLCFVETKSLDGETNLKLKSALPGTLSKLRQDQLGELVGEIEMEHPNKLIDSFGGVISLNNITKEPIMPNNVLLRGCVLRNTEWAVGIVVNTGHDTKIMMSSTATKSKNSNLETATSREIRKIILLLLVVCFTGATGQAVWNEENDIDDIWYLDWSENPVAYWFIDFFYFFLLHATFIPVSLYVSMSIIRYFQAYFMMKDLDMYYETTDQPALVRTMTLNEELGQVSHIFSDKTGTLTCNVMNFRKASINGVSYGLGITEIGKAAWKLLGKPISPDILEAEEKAQKLKVPHVSFYSPKYEEDMAASGPQKAKIQEFFRILSICHDVIPEKIDGKLKLSASNPDDEALVAAAAHFGFSFCDRIDKQCAVENKDSGETEQVTVLHTIAFTSKRKRMSVIIKDDDDVVKIFTKGADTMMLPRLKLGQDKILKQTMDDMRDYAVEGLRCLLIGHAVIKHAEYEKWAVSYEEAISSLTQIELRKAGEPNRIEELEDIIESELILAGATAIEDKLQDGVPECIAELAQAGINLWVLTGDKEETAINIAVACNLVLPKEYMDHIIINGTIAPDKQAMKALFLDEIQRYDDDLQAEGGNHEAIKPRALIIDGPSLIMAMADLSPEGLKELVLDMSQRCKAVVGCRVSPDQKREMVNLIKTGIDGVRTLAIGDGANDVAMIQEAHIGVGIKGEEGVQAVNSSDFAIAQFRFLSDLMLKHGRYNYIRMSSSVCYIFYKNILMSIAQFWFNFSCAFSGRKYYTEGLIQMYNVLFTNFPLLMYGIYDMDIDPSSAHRFPMVYASGINDDYFKGSVFWMWIFSALVESIVISVLPLYTLTNSDPDTGTLSSFHEAGATCFTVVVIVVNLKLFTIQSKWYWASFGMVFLSIGLYLCVVSFINSFILLDYDFYQVWNRLLANPSFWMTVILLVMLTVAKDMYIGGLERNFNYKQWHIIQELEVSGKVNDPIEKKKQSDKPLNVEMVRVSPVSSDN